MDRIRFIGIDGFPNVTYTQKYSRTQPFTIAVSTAGVKVKGVMAGELVTNADLQSFAKVIASAWEDFREVQLAMKGIKPAAPEEKVDENVSGR